MIGKSFSHFKITAKLGEGGMGEVYRAEDTKLGREVAIKVLPAEMADDPERLERFTREAQAIAALNHPNIITIHSVEEAEGLQLLTMELVEGQSLDQVLPATGFGVERLFRLAIQIADALAGAHEKGITHRDLKPANVMVTAQDRVKVLDFGLAKLAETEGDEADTQLLTQAGVILGTVPYMSPEQVQGQPVDPRSDIFSFGILLYEMATGERPFRGENPASVISSVLKDQPPPVTELKGGLPNHLGRIVRRCLEKSPQRRFQSAREVQLELEGLEKEMAMASSVSSVSQIGPQDVPPTATSEATSAKRLAAVVGLVGLLIGALGTWLALRPTGQEASAAGMRQFDLVLDPPPSHLEMAISPDGKMLDLQRHRGGQ